MTLSSTPSHPSLLRSALLGSVGLLLTLHWTPVSAFSDPRAMGMGGIGTASATPAQAHRYNPALLDAPYREQRGYVDLPAGGLRLSDRDDLIGAVQDLADAANSLDRRVRELEQAPLFSRAAVGNINAYEIDDAFHRMDRGLSASEQFVSALENTDGRPAEAELFATGTLATGLAGIGFSVQGGVQALGGFQVELDDRDSIMLNEYNEDMRVLTDWYDNPWDPRFQDINVFRGALERISIRNFKVGDQGVIIEIEVETPEREDLHSQLLARGLLVQQFGASIGHGFAVGGQRLSYGVTPRWLGVETFDYSITAEDDDFSLDRGVRSHSDFDFDLGAAMQWELTGSKLTAGLAIHNLLDHSFTTRLDNRVNIPRIVRSGVAWDRGNMMFGADLDLIGRGPIARGFDEESRYLALGSELRFISFLPLRLGLRTDLSGPYPTTLHGGFGLGRYFDLGIAYASSEYQVASRLGFHW
ncbi:hypothetical protein CKO15_09690 [Halorhodospira abdelmalekii]|uniref:conjugal transfer protein TraF n=1 Tax=Halorhodospira abdelmalekii TaxID=421629 RepID=UPI001906DC67|nr:conjugal transfer protein TraF [Halorhodospira abdelmalekii]MBK1735550.1 hypothetical protein [Halorhodospira abdelmalekii]